MAPRIFIGLKIAPDIAAELAGRAAAVASPAVSFVATADIHLTLVPPWNETNVAEAADKLRRIARGFGAFVLRIERLGYAPDARRPRLLWAECVAGEAITALHAALLQAYGQQDERPFRPHLTLARLGGNGTAIARDHPIEQALSLTQWVESIELFQSPAPGTRGYRVLTGAPIGYTANSGL